MTATEPLPLIVPPPSAWDVEFANLQSRFPKVKPSILFCLHALQQNPDVTVDDLKAQAGMHGIRVTAASVTAAQRLLSPTPPASAPTTADATANAAPASQRRVRIAAPAADAEALIRQMVGKLQSQSNAE